MDKSGPGIRDPREVKFQKVVAASLHSKRYAPYLTVRGEHERRFVVEGNK
jgi:hypothetical protein